MLFSLVSSSTVVSLLFKSRPGCQWSTVKLIRRHPVHQPSDNLRSASVPSDSAALREFENEIRAPPTTSVPEILTPEVASFFERFSAAIRERRQLRDRNQLHRKEDSKTLLLIPNTKYKRATWRRHDDAKFVTSGSIERHVIRFGTISASHRTLPFPSQAIRSDTKTIRKPPGPLQLPQLRLPAQRGTSVEAPRAL